MAPFFKKRLQCFYCGRNSKQTQKSAIPQWQCGECQAVNYLDENGEITDPPTIETSSKTRHTQYAQPISRPTQPEQESSDATIFCAACLKNQFLFTQTLASYLPPQSHPDYEAYEASYPSYKKSLEERYPQVCEKCESRVIDRIQQTGYEAKADHLRRMMERSRGGRSKRNIRIWKWKSLWVSMGAMAFWTSVAGQLVWDLIEFMASGSPLDGDHNKRSTASIPSLFQQCLSQCLTTGNITSQCTVSFQPYAGLSLVLGVLSLWWNPKLRNKVDGYHGRLAGLREYYRIQIFVLMARFIVWAGLQDPTIITQHAKLLPVIHAFMGIFTIISTIASRATIQFDKKPLVNWNDNTETLLRKSRNREPDQTISLPNSQNPFSTQEPVLPRFPVADLAPRAVSPEPYIPPTPPPDQFDDVDAMDWTPSQQTVELKPSSSFNQSQEISTSSPFQGHLPPAPIPPSWHLRSPGPTQIAGAAETKQNPFHNAPVLNPTSVANDEGQVKAKSPEMVMAPPKFFPPGDLTANTGLEHLFDKTFSIADGPSEDQLKQSFAAGNHSKPSTNNLHVLKGCLLFLSMVLWAGTQIYTLPTNSIETVMLGISFLVAGFSLLESLMKPMIIWNATDILLSLFELVISVYLAMVRTHGISAPQTIDNAGIYLAAFMMGQELFVFRPSGDARQKPIHVRDVSTQKKETRAQTPPSIAMKPGGINEAQSSAQGQQKTAAYHETRPSYSQSTSFNMNQDRDTFFNSREQYGQSQLTPTAIKTYQNPNHNNQAVQPLSLSFTSSLGSALPENVLSPGSPGSVSTRSFASSLASEPQTPVGNSRFSAPSLGAPSPSIIKGLSLEDRPLRQTARYPLRNRRS